jgi:hypothetical protein
MHFLHSAYGGHLAVLKMAIVIRKHQITGVLTVLECHTMRSKKRSLKLSRKKYKKIERIFNIALEVQGHRMKHILKEFALLVLEKSLKINGTILNIFPGMTHPAAAIWVCGRALEKRRIDREEWNDWFEQKKN